MNAQLENGENFIIVYSVYFCHRHLIVLQTKKKKVSHLLMAFTSFIAQTKVPSAVNVGGTSKKWDLYSPSVHSFKDTKRKYEQNNNETHESLQYFRKLLIFKFVCG